MLRSLCLAAVVSCLVVTAACRREPTPGPVTLPETVPTEQVPTPAVRTFANLELRLAADDLPAPFAVEVSEGSTLVLRTDVDGVAVVVDAHGGHGADQVETVARRQAARIERMNRGRVHGTESGKGPSGPLVWVRGETVDDDVPVGVTVLVTGHPAGDGLVSLWYSHPPGDDDLRRQQLLELLSHLEAR